MSYSISNATDCDTLMTPVRQLYLHLMSFPAATAALAAWISARGLGYGPVRANVIGQVSCNALIGRSGTVATRRVHLVSGSYVLSEATIVYRDYVLSDELRNRLRSTDQPFGEVITSLGPTRRTTFARSIVAPPMSRLGGPATAFTPVLDVHATVSIAEHGPIARVHESYGAYLLLTMRSPLEHAHDMPRHGTLAKT